jgi:phage gp29-like protein
MNDLTPYVARSLGQAPEPRQLVASQFAAPPAMLSEVARLDQILGIFGAMPDPDEALRRAGIQRHQLRVVEMDDEVTAALDTRREAVTGTPWRLEGSTARARAHIEAELQPHVECLLRGMFASVPYGYSVVEVVYANRPSGRAGIAAASEKPMEWFIPNQDGANLRYRDPQVSSAQGEPVDPRKFLLTVRQGSMRNPYGEALLSRCYWPWYFRQHGWKHWMRWIEKYGTPILLGKTSGDADAMASAMAAALSGSVMAVGVGDEVSAVAPGASGTGTGHFAELDAVLCRRIQKTILGQTLTTDASSGGSFAAAKVADGVRSDRWMADLRLVTRPMQRLVDALHAFSGFGGEAPRFVLADDTGLEVERANRDAVLVEKVGVRFTPSYIAERYDLEPGDFTMTDPAPVAAPRAGAEGAEDDEAPEDAPTPQGDTDERAEPASFAAGGSRFTPVQQGIENSLDALDVPQPIDPERIRSAVLAARDEADLRARLAALVPERDPRFAATLERAQYAAAVLGYVAAEERRA